jgi:hypothetical protein
MMARYMTMGQQAKALQDANIAATVAEFERDTLIKFLQNHEECPPIEAQFQCKFYGGNCEFNNCYECYRAWLSKEWEARDDR